MKVAEPPLPRVEVVWLDAHVDTKSVTTKSAQRIKPVVTFTIGYLISETDEGLTVVSDCYPESPKEGRVPNFMPWGIIKNWHYLINS